MSSRQAVAGAARTTRSASARADSGVVAARSMTPSAAAWRGPSPLGDQAAIVQSPAAGSSRTARAIEPAIRPKPRNASRMSASIAAATVPGQAWPGSPSGSRPVARGSRADRWLRRTAATSPSRDADEAGARRAGARSRPHRSRSRWAPPRRLAFRLRPFPAAGLASGASAAGVGRRRTRVVGRVRASMVRPALRLSTLLPEERAAARAATFLGEERFERRDGVDLATAGPAGESGHLAPIRSWAGPPARPRPSRAGTRSPRASRPGTARTPTGRNDRARTG